jgi:hypothetical protein
LTSRKDVVPGVGGDASSGAQRADAHLESLLNRMTLQELARLRSTLCAELCFGLPPSAQIANALEALDEEVAVWFRIREAHDEAHRVVMLLGALSVAIAWMGARHRPAPPRRLQEAIARVCDKHVYLLPIPRSGPCFCGSGNAFSACHGVVPLRAPEI